MMLILYKLPFLEYPRKTELILNGFWDKHINILLELIQFLKSVQKKNHLLTIKRTLLHTVVPYHFFKVLP